MIIAPSGAYCKEQNMSTITVTHNLSISRAMNIKYNPCNARTVQIADHPFSELLDSPCDLDNTVSLEITVDNAKHLLNDFNNCNRSLKKSRFDLYAGRMADDEWIDSNPLAPLAFFPDGNVATGQHRLAAQIVANKNVSYAVVFNVSEEQREVMDEESHSKVDKILMHHRVTSKVAKAYLEAPRFMDMANKTNFDRSTMLAMEITARTSVNESTRNEVMGDIGVCLSSLTQCMNSIPTGRNVKRGLLPDGVLASAYLYLKKYHTETIAKEFVKSVHLCKTVYEPTTSFDNNCFRTMMTTLNSFVEQAKDHNCKASVKSATKAAIVGKYLQMFTANRHTEAFAGVGSLI